MRRWIAVLVVVFLFVAGGCERKHPAAFNDELVNANRRITKAALDFQRTIRPLKNGGSANAAAVKKAHDDLVKVLDEVQQEAKDMHSPASSSGRNLYKAYQRYLESQQKTVQTHFAEIVKIVEGPGTGTDKWRRIDPLLVKIDQAEMSDQETFKKAHQAYAQTYNLNLTQPVAGGSGP